MKTKLTLTVQKSIINAAKEKARRRNISLSRLFEETFSSKKINKTDQQVAAEKLLKGLSKYPSIETQSKDKESIANYVERKFK